MSTYAVFGMTRPRATNMARKAVDRQLQQSRKHVPESKWTKLVAKSADRFMKSNKVVRLSDKFDAPQFARDFRKLAMRLESRDLHIKAYCKTGEIDLKTGRAKMHWVAAV